MLWIAPAAPHPYKEILGDTGQRERTYEKWNVSKQHDRQTVERTL